MLFYQFYFMKIGTIIYQIFNKYIPHAANCWTDTMAKLYLCCLLPWIDYFAVFFNYIINFVNFAVL